MTHRIYVSRARRGLGYPEARRLILKAAAAGLDHEGVKQPCEIGVLLTYEEGIRMLNSQHRGVDEPTDVLSFPLNDLEPERFDPDLCERDPGTGVLLLGDMAIDPARCAVQAAEYGHSFERELMYLTVHSVLHLLGYDHMDEGAEKRRMRLHEDAVMARLGAP